MTTVHDSISPDVAAHNQLERDDWAPSTSPSTDLLTTIPEFQELYDDPTVEEIWINEPGRIFVARAGKSELTSLILNSTQVRIIAEQLLAVSGRRIDVSHPFADATLADGSRLHIAIPDITRRHWSINIRKFTVRSHTLQQLVEIGSLSSQAASFLQGAVNAGLNLVISGATQSGKTTLMNALLNSAPAHERIITCEEVFELQLTSPDWVAMQTRQPSLEGTGEVTLRQLIKEALRMRPSRLVIGEVRQEECLDLLIAMNSGLPSMCSIHANNIQATLAKMCLLPMLAGNNVSADFVVPTVASVVDLVVHTKLDAQGLRHVTAISRVTGQFVGQTVESHTIFDRTRGELLPTGNLSELEGLSGLPREKFIQILRGELWV